MTDLPARASYIMIGGFLGAGKSTAIGQLARRLSDRGRRVGLITNDQGTALVDTANLRAQGWTVEEITGGCFCCLFDSLLDAAERLTAATRPEVFLAEPVGSCTDLVATVSYPLRRIYGERFRIAPLSVMIDPLRARRVLGLDVGRSFSSKVQYIYRKQLEEAATIVVNKCDLVDAAQRVTLRARLEEEFPGKDILEVSARDGTGLDTWFERLEGAEMTPARSMDVDYSLYAEGEALLGWLNATLELESSGEIDGNEWLHAFAVRIQRLLSEAGAEVAHMKMTLIPEGDNALEEIGVVNLVREDFVPELGQQLTAPVDAAKVVVNLRAEAEPESLRRVLDHASAGVSEATDLRLSVQHVECFSPAPPQPTHRMSE